MTPKLSICMITYKHEQYIAQAIESVLSQKTIFPIELVIGEDCSPDGTRQVIERYAAQHPDVIRPFYRSENMGIKPNLVDLLSRCQGEYIALLEGDDYWIDPYKLQKQVDFLDANPEYVIVGTNALVIREDEFFLKASLLYDTAESFDFDAAYLMEKNPYSTLTVCFRNHLVNEFPEIYYSGIGGDRRLYLLLAQHGKCRYINDVVGVYRIHAGGVTQKYRQGVAGRIASNEEQIVNIQNWNRYFGNLYDEQARRVCGECAFALMQLCVKTGRLRKAIAYAHYVYPAASNPFYWNWAIRFFRFLNARSQGVFDAPQKHR